MRTLIAFDLDGVLYSSEPFLGEAYREAIENVNRHRPGSFGRVPETREILDHVGWPVPIILQRLFPNLEEEAVRLLSAATLRAICARVEQRQGLLYPGVAETLHKLKRAGHLLAVASNGRARYVESVLSTYDIESRFVGRVTADEAGNKTEILRVYLGRWGIRPARVVMVGDRASDVEAARGVGCHFVGCDYGHGYRAEIEAAGPVVKELHDLPAVVGNLLGA